MFHASRFTHQAPYRRASSAPVFPNRIMDSHHPLQQRPAVPLPQHVFHVQLPNRIAAPYPTRPSEENPSLPMSNWPRSVAISGGHMQSLVCFPSPLFYARPAAATSREMACASTTLTPGLTGAAQVTSRMQTERDRRVQCRPIVRPLTRRFHKAPARRVSGRLDCQHE